MAFALNAVSLGYLQVEVHAGGVHARECRECWVGRGWAMLRSDPRLWRFKTSDWRGGILGEKGKFRGEIESASCTGEWQLSLLPGLLPSILQLLPCKALGVSLGSCLLQVEKEWVYLPQKLGRGWMHMPWNLEREGMPMPWNLERLWVHTLNSMALSVVPSASVTVS